MSLLLLAACLAATVAAPAWLLLAGPLVLGVPHVLADLRLLPLSKGAIAAALLLALAAPYLPAVSLFFAWAHNAVAVGAWLWWAKDRRSAAGVAALLGAACVLLLLGVFDGVLGAPSAGGLSLDGLAALLAPWAGAVPGRRLVLVFALTQAFHYAAWLALIPRDRGVKVWGGGPWLVGGAAALTVATLAAGAWSPAAARDWYLRLAGFHGWLELAAFAGAAL